MKINQLQLKRQKSSFVGREKELKVLKQMLLDTDWRLLNVYGPGGIGKTTLLRMFAQSIGNSACCFYLDGHSGFQKPEDVLSKIQNELQRRTASRTNPLGEKAWNDFSSEKTIEMANLMNDYAIQHQGIVLVFDSFEQWSAVENWLRNDFFPILDRSIKVITSGRYMLRDQWLRGDWHFLVNNIELRALSYSDVRTYAQSKGISNDSMIDSLQQFSRGVPLALSMACEIIIRNNGEINFLDQPAQTQMVEDLAAELTKDINDASLVRYTEAASVVWKFDQEFLQTLLQEDIPLEKFREFCGLPFVTRQEEKWALHDSVRQWTFLDLRKRMPQLFQRYRKRALDVLREREAAQPHLSAELAYEIIYLHEDDFVRSICFQLDDRLEVRECRKQDAQQVTQLYLKYLHSQPNHIPGENHLEPLIDPLLRIDPTAFVGLWKGEQLIAFVSSIPLNEQTIPLFRSHPITAPATARYRSKERQYLMCIAGLEPLLEKEISGSVSRIMTRLVDQRALMIDLTTQQSWIAYLPMLGFKEATWADSVSLLGVTYKGFELDLRVENFSKQMNRLLNSLAASTSVEHVDDSTAANRSELSYDKTLKLIQQALKHYSRLPLEPEITGSLRLLLPDHPPEADIHRIAYLLQSEIQAILDSFSKGTKEEQRFYQILHHAYIQKIGTHETVAEYLGISHPSYYRYLRTAVRKLTYEWIKPKH